MGSMLLCPACMLWGWGSISYFYIRRPEVSREDSAGVVSASLCFIPKYMRFV